MGVETGNMQKVKGHFEFAYPHGDGLLIMGWCSALDDVKNELSIVLGVSEREEQVSLSSCVRYWRPDVAASLGEPGDETRALYGFVATFVLPESPEEIELVGVSLASKGSDDDIVALLIPEKTLAEKAMKETWSIWFRVMKHASFTLKMYLAFENLAARFGNLEPSGSLGLTQDLAAQAVQLQTAEPLQFGIDFCARLSDTALIISGWALSLDNNAAITELYLSEHNLRYDFLAKLSWLPRADVLDKFKLRGTSHSRVGFVCLLENCEVQAKEVMVTVVAEGRHQVSRSQAIADFSAEPFRLSEELFLLFAPSSDHMRLVLNQHIGPALKMVWANYRKRGFLSTSSRQLYRFGKEPEAPKVSVIIPLYKRFDFLEYQLSQFALDPYMKQVEIIYVNDDPESQAGLINYCHANYPVFQVPFSLLHAGKNLGYAGANNLGASVARADTLLLLNSDVMPKEEGWLQRLLRAYETKADAGALGVRLLYEDGSIQHDGMTYVRFPFFQDMWICEHPFKGLSARLRPAVAGLREVEAVTGACLMVNKERFKQVGGLDKNYILGDFEDSDLCLKLRIKGFKNYLMSDVSLYHLERQSQNLFANNDWKTKLTIYNCWQHTERWDSIIEQLKEVNA